MIEYLLASLYDWTEAAVISMIFAVMCNSEFRR